MKYELLYVLPPGYTEAELPTVQEKVSTSLRGINATIARHEHAGKIKIAYPIQKNRFGHYFLAEFDSDEAGIATLTANLRLTPEVLRFQVTKPGKGTQSRQSLLSYEDAVARARTLKDTIRAAASGGQTAATSRPQSAAMPPTAPRVQLSEEEIEKKIEKLLSEDEVIK